MAQAAGSVWTDDRLEHLKSLWSKGLSITQIGQEIGVSRNAVVGKVHRMGLPKRNSPIMRAEKVPAPQPVSPVNAMTFQEWDRSKCCWPIGDPKSDDFRFCGERASEGRPYCAHHCAMAYTTTRESNAS